MNTPSAPFSEPPGPQALVLISHRLCPYVQRVAIALKEKGIAFERRDIDLNNKPGWFLAVSPLGKTPVLLVGGKPIFESSVICEYLEDTSLPRLHPADALQRARHRSWMVFGSSLLDLVGAFYSAPDEASLRARAQDIHVRFAQVEAELGEGPWFDGAFSLVDAVFAPVFRYFDVFDRVDDFGFWVGLPKVLHWRHALSGRDSVRQAVGAGYEEELRGFVTRKAGALAARLAMPWHDFAGDPQRLAAQLWRRQGPTN